ncbi:Rho termination factor N-terminal domain-containing protein [Streptomyces sp. NPDC054833]
MIDLMEALQRSVEQGRKGGKRPSGQAKAKRRPAAERKDGRKKDGRKKDGRKKDGRKKKEKVGKGATAELEQLSKGELYEQATKLDISGRSKMNRDQLMRALAKAAS